MQTIPKPCPNCHHTLRPMHDSRLLTCRCGYIGRGFAVDRTTDAELAAQFDLDRAEFAAAIEPQRCTFKPFARPGNLEPHGPRCGAFATHRINWNDGRYSYACKQHGLDILDDEAKQSVASVESLEPKAVLPMPGFEFELLG